MRELRAGLLVFFPISDSDALLCRVRYIGKDYVSLQVVAATAEQVIKSNIGVGEQVNSLPITLRHAKAG